MPDYRMNWKFRAGAYGWSETYYTNTGSLSAAVSRSLNLSELRLKLCGGEPDVVIYERVVTNVLDPEEKEVDREFRSSIGGPFGNTPTDQPWTGANVLMKSTAENSRTITLRGVPDRVVNDHWDQPITSALWIQHFESFQLGILALDPRMQVQDNGVGFTLQDITAMQPNAPHGWVTVTSAAHGLVTGDRIAWFRVKAAPGCFRGVVKVTKMGPNTFQVRNQNVAAIMFKEGRYRKLHYLYVPVATFDHVRVGTHPTGAAGNTTNGRASPCRR